MKIAIVGAGYVGAVTGACLAAMGNRVIVIDKQASKVERIRAGQSPISEPGLEELLSKVVESSNMQASTDFHDSAIDADLILVSVGTPTNTVDGSADLSAIRRVFEDIRDLIKARSSKVAIAITSTVPPGTTNGVARKILSEDKSLEGKFVLAFIPEFLREGSAISDFTEPTRYIVGVESPEEAEAFLDLRPDLAARTYIVGISEAEMLKSVENAWHATKVVFANEIGRLSESLDVDGSKVMELLMLDTKQNISKTYLRPGFAFGGSCLPKDVRSLVRLTEVQAVQAPLLAALSRSNEEQVDYALRRITQLGKSKIGVLGLAFKANTDDIRESPALELIQRLLGRGYEIRVHDFEALRHELYGANLAAFENHSHIRKLISRDLDTVVHESEVIVIAQHNPKYASVGENLHDSKLLLDLTGLTQKIV